MRDKRMHISFVTIVAGVTHDGAGMVEDIIKHTTCRFREVLERCCGITAFGRFEIDLVQDVGELGTFKLRTLSECGFYPGHEASALVPHLHAVVIHPRLRRETLGLHLQRAFPGSRRTQVRPLNARKPVRKNLDNICRYPLKFEPPKGTMPRAGSKDLTSPDPHNLLLYVRMIEDLGGLEGMLELHITT
jgi:hypothetical protein